MDDHRLVVGGAFLHKKLKIGVIRVHGGVVIQVAKVLGILGGASGGRGLKQHVIGQDGNIAVGKRFIHVIKGKLSGRSVPGGPTCSRIGAPSQVLNA
jgi:hypothetical protein